MGMLPSDRITALCFSPDRALLRQLANLLDTFGYPVVCCADPHRAESYLRWARPAICLMDHPIAAIVWPLIRNFRQLGGESRPIVMLIADEGTPFDVNSALENGIDDILARPLRHAEVLTRLRAALRLREFDRRTLGLAMRDPQSGMLSERGLLLRMRKICQSQNWSSPGAIIIWEPDLFVQQALAAGDAAGRSLEESLAEVAKEHAVSPYRLAGHVGQGRFAWPIFEIPDENRARTRAEELRQMVTKAWSGPATISCGVALLAPGDRDLAGLFQRGHLALRRAQDHGRDCVVVSGEFEDEFAQWQKSVQKGNPFQGSSATDVMTPFTLWLKPEDPLTKAIAALRRTHLPLLPVMNASGQLQGLIMVDQLNKLEKRSQKEPQALVGESVSKDFHRIETNANYDRVMRHFLKDQKTPIVFLKDDIPQGFVTFASFVAMVAKLDGNSFAVPAGMTGCSSLLVPDQPARAVVPVAAVAMS